MTFDFSQVTPREADRDGLNAQFYERAASGTLHLQQCAECGRRQHPPRLRCRSCLSERLEWVPVDGVGTLYSWTVTHFPFDRGWGPALPYRTGVVELPDGTRLVGAMSRDVDGDVDPGDSRAASPGGARGGDQGGTIRLDMPVRVVVVVRGDGMPMLSIVPVPAPAPAPDDRPEDTDGSQGHPRPR